MTLDKVNKLEIEIFSNGQPTQYNTTTVYINWDFVFYVEEKEQDGHKFFKLCDINDKFIMFLAKDHYTDWIH